MSCLELLEVSCMQPGDACERFGLITCDCDGSLDEVVTETSYFQMPCALRRMFAIC
jgi:hypothetical protein